MWGKDKMKTKKINITTNYITLGQMLKLTNLFTSGGMIKQYLQVEGVTVNDTIEHRRGRKLYDGDIVTVNRHTYEIATK